MPTVIDEDPAAGARWVETPGIALADRRWRLHPQRL